MNWFKKIYRAIVNQQVIKAGIDGEFSNKPLTFDDFALSGAVTKSAIMGYPPCRRGVLLLAHSVAKLPIHVLKYDSDDNKINDYNHSGYKLLNDSINPYITPFCLKRDLMVDCILLGNGYAFIQRDDFGYPVALLPLDPDATSIESTGQMPIYKTRMGANEWRIPASDMFHLQNAGSGMLGDSLLQIAKQALGLSLSLQSYASKYFEQGSAGCTFIELPASMGVDADKRKQFVEEYRKTYSGLQNSHKTLFLPSGTKPTTTIADNENSQFLQSRQHDLVLVADLIGVEPHLLGAQIGTSYSSLVEMSQSFLTNSLDPFLILWEEQANLKLRSEVEKQRGSRWFEFERKALIRMKPLDETTLVVTQVNNGLLSVEGGRRVLNLPPENEEETYHRPSNIVVEGEEPEPVAPQVPQMPPQMQGDDQGEETPQDQQTTEETRSRAITRQTLGRLITRLQKGVESGKLDLMGQRPIFLDNLKVWEKAETFTDKFLEDLQTELKEVLPEQRKEVFDRINLDEKLEQLCS